MNINSLINYSEKGILSKKIENKDFNITLFCMAKDTEITEHTSRKPGIVYVIEGNGIFNLKGKDIKMQQGIIIAMNKDEVHSLKAQENTSFILMLK